MDQYLELTLLPDPDFPQAMLMSALLAKLHRALHQLQRSDIGISFPEHRSKPQTLGTRLRVHGCNAALEQLQALNWLTGMRDHTQASGPEPVPADARHRCVARAQVDSNPERLRRRLVKRHGISEEEALQRIPDSKRKLSDLPFAQLRSHTTGQLFKLFVRHGPIVDEPQRGSFGSYGLSSNATVPWF
ncbi:type I-F CRISPR-associated endoribonuclease Cas6/Csy4 [Pseudomonas entomophila]|uniref:type I-F CRISPR-associated endoribonuclease Cas6/Csy4 n=1 Tax=Pseudomonas entomophila TaxID=312306 RepID=UPI002405FAF6|nr:type I-F CRISPR-associated endoribonuclease Cas6/Csy4 [Pseudomonas entomophila]MDF9619951.1 type I-F CRISPR-associated endoribonuclease Cas6/Csy4 [Pseudomonas entomophila]